MRRDGDEVHVETDEARGGESTGVMRWVLGVSLFLTIILLSAIWIFGAWTQGDLESETTASGTEAAMMDDTAGTDSIVGIDADEIDATAAEELPPGATEN